MNSADQTNTRTIHAVGYFGLGAIGAVFVSEVVVLMRASEEDKTSRETEDEQVTEVADFWVKLSVLFTIMYMLMNFAYAIDPWGRGLEYANMILPIVLLSFIMSIEMKPLRNDAIYERIFLSAHFC